MIREMRPEVFMKKEEVKIAKAVIAARENERSYISQELHDNVNQILAAAVIAVDMINNETEVSDKNSKFKELARTCIINAIQEIRGISHSLAPVNLEQESLKKIFQNLLTSINLNNRFKIDLRFCELHEKYIKNELRINLYRILQEQVKNILNYSEANEINVMVSVRLNIIRMMICDNGKGFNPKNLKPGIGLYNIQKRVEACAGKCIIKSAPAKGCKIIVQIPFSGTA